jgi:alkanesulfonate monooxygenase SsuD/methylene tetrahydromethanopterin reductase-like flavin-dependent oxidoreductase (luciferase family)
MTTRIGINLSTSARPGSDPIVSARRIEALGFDFVSASDHLHGTHPTFETWTLLTWVAATTERVSVVTNVLGLPYRPPAVTAKMAETLQRLSEGRLVLGLGAGGFDEEFEAFGLVRRRPAEKVEAFEEALRIMYGMWHERDYTFAGRHFRTLAAQLEPKPAIPIPVWVGAYGPKMLDLVGRLADGWLPSLPGAPPEAVPEMRERVRSFVALGFDTLNLWPVGDEAEQHERLAKEVVPQLR